MNNDFMTSKERHEQRYIRRKAKRLNNRQKRCDTAIQTISFDTLYDMGKKCCNGVRWKQSTQRFEVRLLSVTAKTLTQIKNNAWKPRPYKTFTISERGKTRTIDAPSIYDRQVHKVFAHNVIIPLYEPSMIYNNGASMKGKGLKFAYDTLKDDLRKHFKKYGRQGWYISLDFKHFFPSASHDVIFARHEKYLLNDGLRHVADLIVKSIPSNIGMPLGVELSQTEMVAYPSALDNFVRCGLGLKIGHYMDDYYVLIPPNKDPKSILKMIVERVNGMGLEINLRRTRIISLDKDMKFCKAKFKLTDTGKVLINNSSKNLQKARHKLKSFKAKYDRGEMDYEAIRCSIQSIYGFYGQYNNHNKVLKLNRMFYAIFGFSFDILRKMKFTGAKYAIRGM